MKKRLVQLNVAILDPDVASAQQVRDAIDGIGRATTVEWFDTPEAVLTAFTHNAANALCIGIWSVGVDKALKCIADTRDQFPHIPICLVGTRGQFVDFPGVPDNWRRRFEHYYRLTRDLAQADVKREAVSALERMELYLVSKAAKDQLQHQLFSQLTH